MTERNTVLWIDDEAGPEDSLLISLRNRGVDCVVASSSDQGLAVLRANRGQIGLVLLDVMMPPGTAVPGDTENGRFTGLRILEILRKEAPRLPVVILSAHMKIDLIKLVESDVPVFEKPASRKNLIAAILDKLGMEEGE